MSSTFAHNNENYIKKPSSYAREEQDERQHQARIATGNSPEYNNPIISIKGISSCFECQKNDIRYDYKRDEIYCFDCGTVLRQGLTDFTPGLGSFQHTDKSIKRLEILKERDK